MHKFASNILFICYIASNRIVWYNKVIVEKVTLYRGHPQSIARREDHTMAVSKAQQKAVQKYIKDKYDRVVLTMPKGKKEVVQASAARHGLSVNAYINAAIDEKIERDNAEAE